MNIKFRQLIRLWGVNLFQLAPIGALDYLAPEKALCLCYHMVSNNRLAHLQHYEFLTPLRFEQDLNDLEHYFPYISYEQMLDARSQIIAEPTSSICLTFDDGFAECFSEVRPILLRHRAPCIFFIITDLIDNNAVFFETRASLCVDAILQQPIQTVIEVCRDSEIEAKLRTSEKAIRSAGPIEVLRKWGRIDPRLRPLLIWLLTTRENDATLIDRLCQRFGVNAAAYVDDNKPYLSTEQILKLQQDGFTIGAHSRTHRRLQDLSRSEAEDEIVESCSKIHKLTGQSSVPFAFPYSGDGLDRHWLAELRTRYPFIGLFFDTRGLRRDHSHVVQRVFGERFEETGPIYRILRRAWLRRFF